MRSARDNKSRPSLLSNEAPPTSWHHRPFCVIITGNASSSSAVSHQQHPSMCLNVCCFPPYNENILKNARLELLRHHLCFSGFSAGLFTLSSPLRRMERERSLLTSFKCLSVVCVPFSPGGSQLLPPCLLSKPLSS